MSNRIEKIGDATLYLGDCLEILPTLPKVDAVITDPPYGLNGSTEKSAYEGGHFVDSPQYVESVCRKVVDICVSKSKRAAISCGVPNVYKYSACSVVGAFIYPSAASWCAWGTPTVSPILFYGKRPVSKLGPLHHTVYSSDAEKNGHPCPKPLRPWTWLVDRATEQDDVVLDPFMGSGTTGVACAQLGLKFIGIEIEPKYFDIACRRIEQAYAQGKLFDTPAVKQEQSKLEL